MFFLKCFCVILFIAFLRNVDVVALSDAQLSMIQSKFLSGGVKCLKDHPLSFSDVNKLRKKMLPDGNDAKCFAQFLFENIGIMDDMGKLSVEEARQQAMAIFKDSEEHLMNVNQFMETCAKVNEQEINEASCDRAKVLFLCLVDNAPKCDAMCMEFESMYEKPSKPTKGKFVISIFDALGN